MDCKIKLLIVILLCPILINAQGRLTSKYVDSSELQLRMYAAEVFYLKQVYITDSTANKKGVDIYMRNYFETSNYSYEAVQSIMDYSEQEASKNYLSDEIGKCYCYNSSLLFFNSQKLKRKVKSLRKYLAKPPH